jgi:Transcriptional regulators
VSKIQAEIKQTKPFPQIEQEAFVALQRTADLLIQEVTAVLKPFGISPTQYNVLRILRGAGEAGLPCGEIANRMVTRDPDITRLLDRLEIRSLVARTREKRDRRVITARITPQGLALLEELEQPVADLTVRQFANLGRNEVQELIELLDRLRDRSRT